MTVLYILIAILIFGLLVVIHEGGHFLFARLFGVTVNEFSIGMGPKIFSRKSKKTGTAFSLRAFPVGGFVSMVGEDEESEDENAFCNKSVLKRFIITAAGAIVNITVGILIMSVLIASSPQLYGTCVAEMKSETVSESGLMAGDVIVSVGGARVYTANDLVYQIMRRGIEPCDIVVIRNGEKIVVERYQFPVIQEEGSYFGEPDFYVSAEAKTPGNVLKHAFIRSFSSIRMIWRTVSMTVLRILQEDRLAGAKSVLNLSVISRPAVKSRYFSAARSKSCFLIAFVSKSAQSNCLAISFSILTVSRLRQARLLQVTLAHFRRLTIMDRKRSSVIIYSFLQSGFMQICFC